MSAEDKKALVREATYEIWNNGNFGVLEKAYTSDYVSHDTSSPEPLNAQAFKESVTLYRAAFPDMLVKVEDEILEGDMLVERWSATCTHRGEFMGLPPTGKKLSLTGISVVRLRADKIAESWENYDALGMLQQLGAAPAPGN
ncbi:MAG: ester cyclase [Dehalococcoidia bacterium]|nr:ester cyclase [Dehalococcoidia bacterium]